MFPFNQPYYPAETLDFVAQALASGKTGGSGPFAARCERFLSEKYGFGKVLLTSSCTAALEMTALLTITGPGDEVILPSYTFVSTANAFALRGAQLKFADCAPGVPNISAADVETLITPKTRAIVVMHYAGMGCEMEKFRALADRHDLWLIEDAAMCIDASYDGIPLGRWGDLATFSFHETKNLTSGEGGALVINDPELVAMAEIVREKGTDRSRFMRNETDHYTWVGLGSSFLLSDITAAVLMAQLEHGRAITAARLASWKRYAEKLAPLSESGLFHLPAANEKQQHNASLFFLLCRDENIAASLSTHLRNEGIPAYSHYRPLHQSPFGSRYHDGRKLPETEKVAGTLLRLPIYYGLDNPVVDAVAVAVEQFVRKHS